jgi:hypothetical protein
MERENLEVQREETLIYPKIGNKITLANCITINANTCIILCLDTDGADIVLTHYNTYDRAIIQT